MTQPSNLIITFGKHKGLTVEELLSVDPSYVQWLLTQAWLSARFAELHAALVSRGATTDDTPEHNALQARFLDPDFQAATLLAAIPDQLNDQRSKLATYLADTRQRAVNDAQRSLNNARDMLDYYQARSTIPYSPEQRAKLIADSHDKLANAQRDFDTANQAAKQPLPRLFLRTAPAFEVAGVDVVIKWLFTDQPDNPRDNPTNGWTLNLELKPSLSDDYPSVMRQMQRLRLGTLVIQHYDPHATIPFLDLKRMFEANRHTILTTHDIEAKIPEARSLLACHMPSP